jgi:hypothetical protein
MEDMVWSLLNDGSFNRFIFECVAKVTPCRQRACSGGNGDCPDRECCTFFTLDSSLPSQQGS